ncbi:MAG: hypothetical protein V4539_11175 [Bacteroidota bacterium]
MNNNFFSFTRYLRDEGYAAQLFLFNNEQSHFLPQNDSLDDEWKLYTSWLNWGDDKSFNDFDTKKVKKEFEPFHFIIGCGSSPAFLRKAGITIDIFIPYGSDLYSLPYYNLVKPRNLVTMIKRAYWQKKGIAEARNIFLTPTGGKFEKYVGQLGFKGRMHRCGVPMLYWKLYYDQKFSEFKHSCNIHQLVTSLKEKGHLVLVHPCRHNWKNIPAKWSNSGNDILYRAIAKLKEMDPQINISVITFEYGLDVKETKKLIGDLKIEESVYWQPRSTRLEIMAAIQASDLVVGELCDSFLTYGVVYESMVSRKPIMHSCKKEDFKNEFEEIYPMLFANTVEHVVEHLRKLLANPSEFEELGIGSYQWFKHYLVDEALKTVEQLTK